MAGDPFKDAIRARLATHVDALGLGSTFPIRDTDNTSDQPDAAANYLELEFPGGPPDRQRSFGSPGNNWYDEVGQITLNVVVTLRQNRNAAEAAAAGLRGKFRSDRIEIAPGRFIRITGTSPLSDGRTEGGHWVISVYLAYQVFNIG
ncbi:phage tail terminator-like protein [Nitrobacter sp.]|uniref:phage tail terminator-like protein n=1 Tax=Nitrobacter sp. TaxID=29420 RepID=UPI0029CAAF6A|nr:phage tail terminator-like protein [Nitrobacter sp.]